MADFEYITDTRILARFDEERLGELASRGTSKTWNKKALNELKTWARAIFEAYATNKYSITDLRVDPPSEFAVEIQLNLIVYGAYLANKNHRIPRGIQKMYDETMNMLKEFGTPNLVISVEGGSVNNAILYTEADFQFPFDTIAKYMFT